MNKQDELKKNLYLSVGNDNDYYQKDKRTDAKKRNIGYSKVKKGTKLFYRDNLKLVRIDDVIEIDSRRYKHISSIGRQQKIIIGTDDRIKAIHEIFPYKAISLLLIEDKFGETYWGTGFFIAEKCVITAGHCVFFNNNWVKEIKVIPGANGNIKPFGAQISRNFKSVLGWTNHYDNNYDHGAIILNDSTLFNNIKATFDIKEYSNESKIEISGYPTDKNGFQWKSIGTISSSSPNRFFHDLDTLSGNSGSPVYIENGERRTVIGVHTFGDDPNSAVSINNEIFDLWTNWSKL